MKVHGLSLNEITRDERKAMNGNIGLEDIKYYILGKGE
jgi:hypothetical protein